MTLSPGTRLEHYEVLAPLGAGGMGEVYRARDTRLGREVAIKVLPSLVAGDAGRLARFEREARAVAALSHPNILAIHDFGSEEGRSYAVTELLEGETLRERLGAGALPPRKAAEIAVQVAHGLAAAHEKGIVHRDLKPENLFLTKDGRVKILDFGLALQRAVLEADSSRSPTLARPTDAGTVLGTVGYMSPEQVRGESADHRSDIFSLGVVLHEMLGGRRAFQRETAAETMAAILKEDPPSLSSTTPPVPAPLERLVLRCLEKRLEDRFQSVRDVAFGLEALSGASGTAPVPAAAAARRPKRLALALAGAALFALGWMAAAAIGPARRTPGDSRPVRRLTLQLPPDAPLAQTEDLHTSFAISPDGSAVAFVAQEQGGRRIHLRRLARDEVSVLPGTDGALRPFFSPDGLSLAFYADAQLRRVSLTDGQVTTISEVEDACDWPQHGDWGLDGTIVFTACDGIRQVPARGGQASRLIARSDSARRDFLAFPSLLPDGRHVLFSTAPGGTRSGSAVVLSLATGERREVATGVSSCRYAASGHLVCLKAGLLTAMPFDPVRAEVMGAPFPLAESVAAPYGQADCALSPSGTLLYRRRASDRALTWVSREGKVLGVLASGRAFQHPRLAPDGRQIAVEEDTGAQSQIWLVDAARGTVTLMTTDGDGRFPIWTPDGKRVTFSSMRQGGRHVFWQSPDGSRGAEKIDVVAEATHDTDGSWSPDGRVLAHTAGPDGRWRVFMLRPGSGRPPERFLTTDATNWEPRFSPDGRWIAYSSDESGRFEVYVRSFPEAGHRVQVSVEGGHDAVWARSGRELFYRKAGRLYAVPIVRAEPLSFGEPRLLFEGPYMDLGGAANYDVTPDGQRFLMVKVSDEEQRPTRLEVVLNWFEDLRARSSGGGAP